MFKSALSVCHSSLISRRPAKASLRPDVKTVLKLYCV